MPPRRKKPSGLTEDDVARLRSQLGEGRRPRVTLSGPQFETDASGSVVRIGDPAIDGADFLTVRVKVNGVTDELAFAPAELSIGSRPRAGSGSAGGGSARAVSAGAGSAASGSGSAGGRTQTAPRRPAAAAKPATASSAVPTSPTTPAPSTTAATDQGGSPAAADASSDRASSSEGTAPPGGTAPASVSPHAPAGNTPAGNPAASSTPTGNATAGRRRKAPAAPAVSVTISSTGASWTVSASRGARTIAKNAPVAPGLVTAVADLLGQPGLAEAVAEINETARLQAEQRAEQLRAELSDLEAMLATHRSPR
jgi:hypothetical protein